jgi:hypothetical protein
MTLTMGAIIVSSYLLLYTESESSAVQMFQTKAEDETD